MALVSITLAKLQTKVDGNAENELLNLYIAAAESSAIQFLNRKVYASKAELDAAIANETAGLRPMVVNEQIQSAILLTLSYLHKNRGDANEPMPEAAITLLWPFRVDLGV